MPAHNVNAALAAERVWMLTRDLREQSELWIQGHTALGDAISERNPDVREYRNQIATGSHRQSRRSLIVDLIAEIIAEEMARLA